MNRTVLIAGCASAAAALSALVVLGEELSLVPRQGVVLLNNGELIAGTIIAAGDRYDIHLEAGEISVKRASVAMVCRDAAECYLNQRRQIDPGRTQGHLELAQWCIKNNLLEEAEKELADARAIDAGHPAIRLVESRLELARTPPPSAAAAETPVAAAPARRPDSVGRDLAGGAVENFTNTIQPMLLNYCAKGGCHAGRGQGGLKLERMHPKLTSRSTTQRNFRRVLTLIDRNDPAQSKLLVAPIRPHGGRPTPVFTDRDQSQYKQLAQWVLAVAGNRRSAAPPTLEERTAPLLQAVPGASGAKTPEAGEVPADTGAAAAAGDPAGAAGNDGSAFDTAFDGSQALTPEEVRALGLERQATSNVQYGAAATSEFVPKDPFDPEIFNRRFFGR